MARLHKDVARSTAEAEKWLDELDPDDPSISVDRDLADLREIGTALYAVEAAETDLVRAIALAKHAGRSWTDIANILGVSRQAARQRFSSKIDVVWPSVRAELDLSTPASRRKPA